MFTLGYKEVIVNGLNSFKFNSLKADGTAPSAATDVTKKLSIEGVGTFDSGQVVKGTLTEATAATYGTATLNTPNADQIGLASTDVRVPVIFSLRINTSRAPSEFATDFIKMGLPFIINLNLDGGDSSSEVADKIIAAFKSYEAAFPTSDFEDGSLPFNWTESHGIFTLTLKEASLSFDPAVTFLKKWDTFGLSWSGAGKWSTSSSFGGVEAIDGKYLEENVVMATPTNSDIYGINTGEVPVLGSLYHQYTLEMKVTDKGIDGDSAPHAHLSIEAADAVTANRNIKFVFYFNADAFTDVTGSAVGNMLQQLVQLVDPVTSSGA